jgi:hypothetical protein
MNARCSLFVAALALAAAAPSRAEPLHSDLFQPLLEELNDRDIALPVDHLTKEQKKQRSALRKSFRALEYESKDLAGDLRTAQKMTKALDAGYPVDFEMAGLLDDLNGALGALVLDGRDQLEVAIAGLAEGKYKTKALAKLVKADAVLLDVALPGTRTRLAGLHRKCWSLILSGGKIAAKAAPGGPTGASVVTADVNGAGWTSNSQFGSAVVGIAQVSESTGGVRKVLFTGRRILPHSENADLPGETTRLQVNLAASWADITSGVFTVGGGDGVTVSVTWTHEDEDGNLTQAVATEGSVTIDTIETTLGSVSVTGTFQFTMYDGGAATTFPITSGLFEVYDLPRTDVP